MEYKFAKLNTRLRILKSLITHAKEIENDNEVIVRSLREQHINPSFYEMSQELSINILHLKEIFGASSDFVVREFTIAASGTKAAIVFIESMINQEIISEQVIKNLTMPHPSILDRFSGHDNALAFVKETLLTVSQVCEQAQIENITTKVLFGEAVLLIDGINIGISFACRKLERRSISEPPTESDIRGPRDGFTEDLKINVTLVRRRLQNPNLIVKQVIIGERSNTNVAIVYFRGIANSRFICEIEKRVTELAIDMPIGGHGIESMIEDHPLSPFPTSLATERPDTFTSSILEGKIGLIVDGTPFGLIMPATLADFFQAGDDFYEKWIPAILIRMTRYVAAVFTTITPALYVAMTTFHPGLIPTPLTLTIVASRLGIPFPALLEALFMVVVLEILQEAGVRLPKTVGPAVSIVGGLVIGDAAVRAGLVSPGMVIITAFTAIAGFTIPNYRISLTLRIFRIPFMLFAAAFGMYGLIIGILGIAIHLSMLESLGVPYLAPFIPGSIQRLSDVYETLIVVPPSLRNKRPAYLKPQANKRQK